MYNWFFPEENVARESVRFVYHRSVGVAAACGLAPVGSATRRGDALWLRQFAALAPEMCVPDEFFMSLRVSSCDGAWGGV